MGVVHLLGERNIIIAIYGCSLLCWFRMSGAEMGHYYQEEQSVVTWAEESIEKRSHTPSEA